MANEIINRAYPDQKPGSIPPVGSISGGVGSGTFGSTSNSIGGPSAGYHPKRLRMTIETEKRDIILVCDYDPTEFTEKHGMEWSPGPVSGRGAKPIEFMSVNPREWSMKLLFNTLGDNIMTRNWEQESYVSDALAKLRQMSYPNVYNGVSTSAGYNRPPTLNVFLIDKHFRCVITGMSTTVKAIHPTGRFPTRAEVDITFTEFVEGSA